MDSLRLHFPRLIPFLTAFLVFLATGRIRLYAQTGTGSGDGGGSTTGEVDIDVNVDDGGVWYSAWWVWVVGLALFIIIIVAIVSAGRR